MTKPWFFGILALALAACGDEDPPHPGDSADSVGDTGEDSDAREDSVSDTGEDSGDAGEDSGDADPGDTDVDSDAREDGVSDTGEDSVSDTGEDSGDAGEDTAPPEDVLPLPGFGVISGECGLIDDELLAPEPYLFSNALDFLDDPYDGADFERLTEGGQRLVLAGNAGGSSLYSELFAYEVLARCEGAELIATETEIRYDTQGKITDLLVDIGGYYVGVSVVRAVNWPRDEPYPVEKAASTIGGKLEDILVSSANVSEAHRWVKQILSVIAYDSQHAAAVVEAWAGLPDLVRADTVLLVTTTEGDDAPLY